MPDPQIDQPSDELILQHLGAAVMLCWAKLPYPARNTILEQTGDIIGLAHVPNIRHHILELLARRT
jgi:hypothetical protein